MMPRRWDLRSYQGKEVTGPRPAHRDLGGREAGKYLKKVRRSESSFPPSEQAARRQCGVVNKSTGSGTTDVGLSQNSQNLIILCSWAKYLTSLSTYIFTSI